MVKEGKEREKRRGQNEEKDRKKRRMVTERRKTT